MIPSMHTVLHDAMNDYVFSISNHYWDRPLSESHEWYFADYILRCILLNENFYILIQISLKCGPEGVIDHMPSLD